MRWIDPTDLGASIPNAVQVTKIVRHRTQHKTGKHSRETVYVITDLTSREASPVLADYFHKGLQASEDHVSSQRPGHRGAS